MVELNVTIDLSKERLLTPDEVIELLRLEGPHPRRQLKHLCEGRRLGHIRVSRNVTRFRLEDVERYLAGQYKRAQ